MDFSNRIINARKEKGLSQEALAELIGVSRQAVSKWETGEAKPDMDKLISLSVVLERSIDYLCLGKEPADTASVTAPPVEPITFDAEKEPPSLKTIQMLLITILASLAIIVLGFLGFQAQINNPIQFPQTGHVATVQEVLNSFTIYSATVTSRGKDLIPTIEGSFNYLPDHMEMQLILEYENFPSKEPVILSPTVENGLFRAEIPKDCYNYNFSVRVRLHLDGAQRTIPLMTHLMVDEQIYSFTLY